MTIDVQAECGIRYGNSGKLLDIYRPAAFTGPAPLVLLWHGRGLDERDILSPLARAAAAKGLIVVVPDWRSDAPDGGRAHLQESLQFARGHTADLGGDPAYFVLAGWSLGGLAAMGIATHPETAGDWRPTAVVGIASSYRTAAPTTGTSPLDDLTRPVRPLPVYLVHGTSDTVVDIRHSRKLFTEMQERNWPVSIDTPESDHAGVVMTEYDPRLGRCRPARADHAQQAGKTTARILAQAAGLTSSTD